MAASVVYYGQDLSDRRSALTGAGYSVSECGSLVQLNMHFQSGGQADAVLLSNGQNDASGVVWIARPYVSSRIVLFQDTQRVFPELQFGLSIPPLTPPGRWLFDLAGLLEWSRAVRLRSQKLREQSEILREESAKVREISRVQHERSAAERSERSWNGLSAVPAVIKADRVLICVDCKAEFVFSADEQEFFEGRGFVHEPKHCKRCRTLSSRRYIETTLSCADCGRSTTVPFQPMRGKPVYCRACLLKHLTGPHFQGRFCGKDNPQA